MPQLVKGGKHTFGWSRVGNGGRMTIPAEALEEYRLGESVKLLVLPGSRTSGGFGLASVESVRTSPLEGVLKAPGGLGDSRAPEGAAVDYEGRPYAWAQLRNGGITLPPATLEKYGIAVGDRLLVVRGSGLALGFAVRGPIVEEANMHGELEVFEP